MCAIGYWGGALPVTYIQLVPNSAPAGTCTAATLLTYCGAHGPVEGGGGELGERVAQLGGLGLGLG